MRHVVRVPFPGRNFYGYDKEPRFLRLFHSLRHTTTRLLKNASASEAAAMDITGHDRRTISQNSAHVEEDAKRRVLAFLPDITKGGEHMGWAFKSGVQTSAGRSSMTKAAIRTTRD
jgi:hypothetical protein